MLIKIVLNIFFSQFYLVVNPNFTNKEINRNKSGYNDGYITKTFSSFDSSFVN